MLCGICSLIYSLIGSDFRYSLFDLLRNSRPSVCLSYSYRCP